MDSFQNSPNYVVYTYLKIWSLKDTHLKLKNIKTVAQYLSSDFKPKNEFEFKFHIYLQTSEWAELIDRTNGSRAS